MNKYKPGEKVLYCRDNCEQMCTYSSFIPDDGNSCGVYNHWIVRECNIISKNRIVVKDKYLFKLKEY